MKTIKKFTEFINETVDIKKGTLFNDDDFKEEKEKNWERKKLIKDIWKEIKSKHLDEYLDFPEFDYLSNDSFYSKKGLTDDEKKQVFALISPEQDKLSKDINGFNNVPMDIFIYPNVTVKGEHIDDIYINFNLLDEDGENIENSDFFYNSVDDQISWETVTDFQKDLTWDDLNPTLEEIIVTIINVINPDSKYLS